MTPLPIARREYARSEIRENYAGIVGELIQTLAMQKGWTEGRYRRFIQTDKGRQVFAFWAGWYRVPVFFCNYQARKVRGNIGES